MSFPLSPAPSTYTTITWQRAGGVFYPGEAVACTLNKSGATAYTVRNLSGAVVSSGAVSGTSLTVTAPAGGWLLGWYRLYLTGPTSDTLFGLSYGVTNFVVINSDARFPTAPVRGTATNGGAADYSDLALNGVFSWGPVRFVLQDAANPTTNSPFNIAGITDALTDWKAWYGAGTDGNRTVREALVAIPYGGYDRLVLNGADTDSVLSVYCKDETVDGTKVFIAVAAGTSSGVKLTVAYPNAATVVATYDNKPDGTALALALQSDSYVRGFIGNHGYNPPVTRAATAIGNAYKTGLTTAVAALYTAGARWFEGPSNEPGGSGAEHALQMRLFRAAVQAGNASAKVAGPCHISMNGDALAYWQQFFAAGGGSYLDAVSTHAYNSQVDDLYMGKRSWAAFKAVVTAAVGAGFPLWQTENGNTFVPVYGVHHPKRAVRYMRDILLAEQNGIPRERNILFNDTSHGFWSFPTWIVNGDSTVNPQGPMMRTLAEQTYGRPFASAVDFGTPGNTMYLGSVYTSPADSTSTLVLIGATPQPNGQVTLTLGGGGAATVTAADCFGNTSTLTVAGGRVVVPVLDRPVYLSLPAGVTATPHSVNDWPPLGSATLGNHLPTTFAAKGKTSGSETEDVASRPLDATWGNTYNTATETDFVSMTAGLPAWWRMQLNGPHRFDRVTIWGPPVWQGLSRLLDFDIQTSTDGTTWTTRKTITQTASSFLHGAAAGTGTQYECYDDEIRIFDVKLDAPVVAQYVRIYVRDASYGGEPDAQTSTATFAQSATTKQLCLQQVALYCDATAAPALVVTSGGSTL